MRVKVGDRTIEVPPARGAMHTNGPEQRDCDRCGQSLGNRPRITIASTKVGERTIVVCKPCYEAAQATAARDG